MKGEGKFHTAQEDMQVWKKVLTFSYEFDAEGTFVRTHRVYTTIPLTIPFGTQYFDGWQGGFNKCRAAKAIIGLLPPGIRCLSHYERLFVYESGKTIIPLSAFNDKNASCCGSGIHFFKTRAEADNYNFQ